MATQPHSIFAASRAAAQKIMDDRDSSILHFETTEHARVRSVLRQHNAYNDDEISLMLRHYDHISRIRASLNLSLS